MKRCGIVVLLLIAVSAGADTVHLKSGAVIAGEIIGEDAYEVRILVSRTVAGDVRTVKAIDQASVESLQRDAPEVAVESDPLVAGEASEAEQAPLAAEALLVDPIAMREARKRADALTGDGQYDDAIRVYRAVIDTAGRQADALRTSLDAGERTTRLDMLRMSDETYALLLIALQGRLDLKRATVEESEQRAQQLAREISRTREELDGLVRESRSDADEARVRRLGTGNEVPAVTARVRDLQARLAAQERQVQLLRQRAAEERVAMVNSESEIEVAREKARQAAKDYAQAERATRARR